MSWEAMLYARGRVAHAAALGRVALLDVPHLDLNDEEGLRAQALRAKAMGFTGKFAIHPRQVGPTRECFTPSDSQIASARLIVEAAARGQGQVCVVDGRMVDEPVVQSARRILARAGV
jgi:citrate lyase beta subunit